MCLVLNKTGQSDGVSKYSARGGGWFISSFVLFYYVWFMGKTGRGSGITVAELIDRLKRERQDVEIYFSGLEFYRTKDRGGFVQIEFAQMAFEEHGRIVFYDPDDPEVQMPTQAKKP